METNKELFNKNITALALENEAFHRVILTGEYTQLLLMHLDKDNGTDEQVFEVDQTLMCIAGEGKYIADGLPSPISVGNLIFIPAGISHAIINTGEKPLKLALVIAPPHFDLGTVHETKTDDPEHALRNAEHAAD